MELDAFGKRLRAAREKSGKSAEEIAQSVGISVPAYYDLETFDDELTTSLPIQDVALLFKLLGIQPANFFHTAPVPDPMTVDVFVEKIVEYLKTRQMSVEIFEDLVGWDIEPLLNEPEKILSYDIDALREISSEVGIEWLSLLQAISIASKPDLK